MRSLAFASRTPGLLAANAEPSLEETRRENVFIAVLIVSGLAGLSLSVGLSGLSYFLP